MNRTLEEHEGRRVGATRSYKTDVRVISASNRDLRAEVSEGRFREDLFYRLNVMMIKLPPLREHREDIPLIVAHFLKEFDPSTAQRQLTPDSLKALLRYPWPGNVRELRNAIESALAVADGEEITVSDLPANITGSATDAVPAEHLAKLTYQEACELGRDRMVRQYLAALMKRFRGNVTAAAEQARVERETLHRSLRKHNVSPSAFRR